MKIFLSSLKIAFRQIVKTPPLKSYNLNYDNYWVQKKGSKMGNANSFQISRANWISTKIDVGDSILDLGAGDGAVLLQIKKKMDINIIASDISQYARLHLKKLGIKFVKCDFTKTSSFKNLPIVDHIFLLEVLEHLSNPEEILLESISVCDKSVIFSFPNSGYFSYRLRFLFGRFPVQWRAHPSEHLRFWTYKDLIWWLVSLRLYEKSEIHIYEGLPFFSALCPSLFGAAFIVQVKK
jgi:2-polyprenyl-3-methyl-5-hydroxy-6-metoxy-1,4-benzoquinol methylase